jgi:phage terminase small subunit
MGIEELKELLKMWVKYMRSDHTEIAELGFPKKSAFLSTGGESAHDSFEQMFHASEIKKVEILHAVIHSLEPEQQKAIYHFHLKTKEPLYATLKYQNAIDNLLTIVGRRIG